MASTGRRWDREARAARYGMTMAMVLWLAPIPCSMLSEFVDRTVATIVVALPIAWAAAVVFARRAEEAMPSGDRAARPSKPVQSRWRDARGT